MSLAEIGRSRRLEAATTTTTVSNAGQCAVERRKERILLLDNGIRWIWWSNHIIHNRLHQLAAVVVWGLEIKTEPKSLGLVAVHNQFATVFGRCVAKMRPNCCFDAVGRCSRWAACRCTAPTATAAACGNSIDVMTVKAVHKFMRRLTIGAQQIDTVRALGNGNRLFTLAAGATCGSNKVCWINLVTR